MAPPSEVQNSVWRMAAALLGRHNCQMAVLMATVLGWAHMGAALRCISSFPPPAIRLTVRIRRLGRARGWEVALELYNASIL